MYQGYLPGEADSAVCADGVTGAAAGTMATTMAGTMAGADHPATVRSTPDQLTATCNVQPLSAFLGKISKLKTLFLLLNKSPLPVQTTITTTTMEVAGDPPTTVRSLLSHGITFLLWLRRLYEINFCCG